MADGKSFIRKSLVRDEQGRVIGTVPPPGPAEYLNRFPSFADSELPAFLRNRKPTSEWSDVGSSKLDREYRADEQPQIMFYGVVVPNALQVAVKSILDDHHGSKALNGDGNLVTLTSSYWQSCLQCLESECFPSPPFGVGQFITGYPYYIGDHLDMASYTMLVLFHNETPEKERLMYIGEHEEEVSKRIRQFFDTPAEYDLRRRWYFPAAGAPSLNRDSTFRHYIKRSKLWPTATGEGIPYTDLYGSPLSSDDEETDSDETAVESESEEEDDEEEDEEDEEDEDEDEADST